MPWAKASDALVEAFRGVAPGGPAGEERKMFGYPACFVGGNFLMGLHELGFVFKLGPEDRDAALRAGAMPFAPVQGRVMKEFVVWNEASLPAEDELRDWAARAYAAAAALPVKEPKARSPRAKRPAG